MPTKIYVLCLAAAVLTLVVSAPCGAGDWPAFRHDNARSAVTEEAPETPLALQWTFVPPHPPEPAWPKPAKEKPRVRFDEVYHVAVAEGAVYFGSSADNKLYCLDAATGELRWNAFTGGPIRVAPTVAQGRVYVGSDDGHAYCFNAKDGTPVWKMRAAYRDDKLLGNGKMISMWPVRTGVVVEEGVAYFGAGVFPHETTFLYAVDATDGSEIWCNDTFGQSGYRFEFGGISPQGPLLLSETTVFMPSGRAMPGAFDRDDGKLLNFLSPGGKVGGTWALLTENRLVAGVEAKRTYDTRDGRARREAAYAWFPGLHLAIAEDAAYMTTFEELVALDRSAFKEAEKARAKLDRELRELTPKRSALQQAVKAAAPDALAEKEAELQEAAERIAEIEAKKREIAASVQSWKRPTNLHDALILAGDTLVLGGQSQVEAVETSTGVTRWQAPVEGRACGLAVADGRLYVSTDTGNIACFAPGDGASHVRRAEVQDVPWNDAGDSELITRAVQKIINDTRTTRGYCLVYGLGSGQLAATLAKETDLKIVGIDEDPVVVEQARRALDAAGLYGTRVSLDCGDLRDLPYPDYFADLAVSETMLSTAGAVGAAEEILRVLKPGGGVLCLARPQLSQPGEPSLETMIAPPKADGAPDLAWLLYERPPLEGAGAWTHQYADPANTACAQDELVRGALGTLWFGEPGPEKMVERHARAAAPVSMDGRLFVQGEDVVMAYDAYNGTKLWEREIDGAVRVRVDSDMGNLALERDGLYVAANGTCHRLDPATGETIRTYGLPDSDEGPRRWGYLACADGLVFGSSAAPLARDYASFWADAISDSGEWRDLDKLADRQGLPNEYRQYIKQLRSEFREPSEQAYWRAQQRGFMWGAMDSFPAWGSVESPQGAVTERIMASDTLFAMDTATGALQWRYDGTAVAHPAIAIGDGTVFLADCAATEAQKQAAMAERARLIAEGVWEEEDIAYSAADTDIRLVVALDAASGERKWERVIDLTGCGGDRMGMAYQDGVLCFFGCFSNHDRSLFKEGKLAWRRITAIAGGTGADLWSRPLNYLRRPVIVNGEILIEPRACDLRTGAVKRRLHPLTGEASTWEYVRPGHCCSATSAAPNMFFLRGYFLWYYDLEQDQGMLPFGGIRPGCWINTIPANGLVLFPEASAGCTCSYPIRSTVVMAPKKQQRTWAVCVQNGPMTPVEHLGINFGAPGDWRDENGRMWFGYPHPPSSSWHTYGINFNLDEAFSGKSNYFERNFEGPRFADCEKPWLVASGCEGIEKLTIPLLDEDDDAANYTLRLYFMDRAAAPGERVFAVNVNGETALEKVDIAKQGEGGVLVEEIKGVQVNRALDIAFVPEGDAQPILNGLECIREDNRLAKTDTRM